MPIYEYRCTKGHTFDVMQRFSDDALNKCEVCGAPAQRVLHAPAIHFKGSGFYNTDYGTKKRSREMTEQKESTKKEAAASSSDSKSSDSSSSSSSSGSDSGSSSGSGSGGSGESSSKKSSDSSPTPSKAKSAD
jgi:putative FmdB family regulatory protein